MLETLGMQVYLTLATFVASLGASRLKPAWIQVTRCPTGLMVAVPAVDSYFLPFSWLIITSTNQGS